ncbi:MAG TPA: hypothetical protein VN722_06520 [Hanamia sp.]|nr:hypothetical protein [Hanamia sp.]
MRRKKIPFFVITSFLLFSYNAKVFSQSKNQIGLTFIADKTHQTSFRSVGGISFERLFNKYSGLEIELNYRTFIDDKLIIRDPSAYFIGDVQVIILQNFLNIPLLYLFRTRILTFSIGPSADIYIGFKDEKHVGMFLPYLKPAQYKFDNKLLWGAIAKISKTIQLNKKFILEPDIYFNPIFTPYSLNSKRYSSKRQYYGLGIVVKYIF